MANGRSRDRRTSEARSSARSRSGGDVRQRRPEWWPDISYLIFNEGYLTTAGSQPLRRDLAQDAEWLAGLLVRLLPDEPEPLGLLALSHLHLARWPSRVDADGRLVLLEDQDRSLWNRVAIERAVRLLEQAAAYRRPGRYQIEAAIAAVHCEAASWEETDWAQLLALYTFLTECDPSPVVRLNRAIVLDRVEGAEAALRELDALSGLLADYHLFHAAQATFLRKPGRLQEANIAEERALALAQNDAERALLGARLSRAAL